jgi:hypothetical protein
MSDLAPENLTCMMRSMEGSTVKGEVRCGASNYLFHAQSFSILIEMNWHNNGRNFSLYDWSDSDVYHWDGMYRMTGDIEPEVFKWNERTYLRWGDPHGLMHDAWPIVIRTDEGYDVKMLSQFEELDLSEKYCGQKINIWWNRYLGGDAGRIIAVGDGIQMPESGYLPLLMNFSEQWVILSIEEKEVGWDEVEVTFQIENIETGMVFEFDFTGDAESGYLRFGYSKGVSVTCPLAMETIASVGWLFGMGIGGALAVIVGLALYVVRKREMNQVLEVPAPFVGGDDLAGIITPAEVESVADSSN